MRRVQGLSRPLLQACLLRSASLSLPSPAPSSSSFLPPPRSWLSSLAANSRVFSLPSVGVLSSSFATAGAAATREAPVEAVSGFHINELVLYQYAACPFCNKVRAFLDYNKLPYKVVEVNPISKKEIKWSEYKKVPVVILDGKQLNDSFQIIESLQHQINPTEENSVDSAVVEEKKWCRWVDDHLVHVLAPNIYRSPSEALESFDYITTLGNFTTLERWTAKYAGAAAMYLVSKKLKKKHNISDEHAALYAAADTWIRALNGRQFMGGNKPNLADLSVFGVLRPIWNLQSGIDLAKNTGIETWYKRMETEVGESSEVKD